MNNIITFENNKYQWQDLFGEGRCLVPYKEPINKFANLKTGDYVCSKDKREILQVIRKSHKFYLVYIKCGMYVNGLVRLHIEYNSLSEIVKMLNDSEYYGDIITDKVMKAINAI